MLYLSVVAKKLYSRTNIQMSGCWNYLGGKTGSGYGAVCIGEYKSKSAHVISYELYNGPVSKGMFVLHKCDNKLCVNPSHLFLGTVQDNKNDEVAKGRHVRGERQGQAKLTTEKVVQIKKMLKEGISPAVIGSAFNVTPQAIVHIQKGVNWRHV